MRHNMARHAAGNEKGSQACPTTSMYTRTDTGLDNTIVNSGLKEPTRCGNVVFESSLGSKAIFDIHSLKCVVGPVVPWSADSTIFYYAGY